MKKKKIHLKLVSYLDDSIKQLEKTVAEFEVEADLDESAVKDPEDLSFQNSAIEMLNHYKSLLVQAKFNRQKLETLPEVKTPKIMPGSVVETKQVLFYIGIPTSPLPFNEDKLLIGISTESKLAKSLKSKKIGDSVTYGKSKLKVLDIF